jgi:hypothetical protein
MERYFSLVLNSGVIQESVRGLANIGTSVAQAAATNPLAAGTTAILVGGVARPFIGASGKNLLYGLAAAHVGASVVKDAAGGIAGFLEAVPGSGAAASTAVSISYDIPDIEVARGSSIQIPSSPGGRIPLLPR